MYGMYHMRLFRHGRGRCEQRLYNQHYEVDGPTEKLKGMMIDDMRMSLKEFLTRHIRWVDWEMEELLTMDTSAAIGAKWSGTPIQRKRSLRSLYVRLPLFVRSVLLFLYRYVIRLGFLDGREGLIFYVMQTFWFHFLIDSRIYEEQQRSKALGTGASN
jgi:hypothetical protein